MRSHTHQATTAAAMHQLEARRLLTTFNPVDGPGLTAALNSAQLGDTIVLNAGTTYTGGFLLPNKTTGSGWITIRTSNLAQLPAEGIRVSPSDAPNMARLQAPGSNVSVVSTKIAAHHYKFIGIEFVGPATGGVTGLISLGTDTTDQSTYASVANHIIIDRSYMHPATPTQSIRRAIALNSAFTDITNSYIQEIHEPGSDSQAIGGWNGTGPYNIINNHLEGASENIMFGGGTHRIPGYTPSDIVIRGNDIVKPLSWRGYVDPTTNLTYNVKNLFELKCGRRVTLENNILENNWADGQDGTAVVIKLGNWSSSQHLTTEDVVVRNNIIRHSANAVVVQGRDYAENSPPGLVRRITFTNNLFYDINKSYTVGGTGIGGNFVYLTQGPLDVTFDHNTIDNGRTMVNVDTPQYPTSNFRFTNNIIAHNTYGIFGAGASPSTGDSAWDMYFYDAGARLLKNVIMDDQAKATLYDNVSRPVGYPEYPTLRAANFWPTTWGAVGFVDQANANYRLAASSPYNNAGTDGKDVGADQDAIDAATATAISGGDVNKPFLGAPTPQFQWDAPQQQLAFDWDESVVGFAADDLQLQNLTTGTSVPAAGISLNYEDVGNEASATFPGGLLADGNYRLTIAAGAVSDRNGNDNEAVSYDFFVLTGDANHDRVVDTLDFNALAANFGQTGRTFSQGNFNYDGVVDTLDFNALASQFGVSLAPPDAVMAASSAPRPAPAPQATSLFSAEPVLPTDLADSLLL